VKCCHAFFYSRHITLNITLCHPYKLQFVGMFYLLGIDLVCSIATWSIFRTPGLPAPSWVEGLFCVPRSQLCCTTGDSVCIITSSAMRGGFVYFAHDADSFPEGNDDFHVVLEVIGREHPLGFLAVFEPLFAYLIAANPGPFSQPFP